MKKSPEAVRAKMKRLGLAEVDKQQSVGSRLSTTTKILPETLISLEQALKMLAGALKILPPYRGAKL